MKLNKKRIIILGIISCFLVISILLLVNNLYSDKNISVIDDKKGDSNTFKMPGMVSLMLETKAGSGEYKVSSEGAWPSSKYELNTSKSGCENGGKISFNESTKKITIKTNTSDKCYAYFDIIPPDVSVSITNRASTYGRLGTINCTGGSAIYNQQYNRIEVSSIDNKFITCNLNYTESSSKVNLATYITNLAGTTQGNGQVVNENGYRYEGKNPNNYIWFNNEYWRIIGVFDSDSHGQSGKNLVKIIREETIGGLPWNMSNANDWTAASLNKLLNGAYYNAQDGTDSGYCRWEYNLIKIILNCDYTKKRIQSGYRGMIVNVTWYLGGYSSEIATTDAFYGYERGTTVYSGRPTSTTGYIGLMYPSDYGYSVLASSCARTTNLSSYKTAKCAGQSWLYGKGNELTLTHYSSNNNRIFYLYKFGSLNFEYSDMQFEFRPVLYLDASVYKIDGDGSINDPFIIGM